MGWLKEAIEHEIRTQPWRAGSGLRTSVAGRLALVDAGVDGEAMFEHRRDDALGAVWTIVAYDSGETMTVFKHDWRCQLAFVVEGRPYWVAVVDERLKSFAESATLVA